jgi:general stress protein 26
MQPFILGEAMMENAIQKMYEKIEDLKTAMMVTRRADGHLVSRAMAMQKSAPGADLWFVAAEGSAKLHEIRQDPHINLSCFDAKTMEWISISGLASISNDRSIIQQLYEPDWKAWFPNEGDPRHGTPNDPRMVLIGVTVHAAVFFEVSKPRPVVLFEIAKGWVTGTMPEIGEVHHIDEPAPRKKRA